MPGGFLSYFDKDTLKREELWWVVLVLFPCLKQSYSHALEMKVNLFQWSKLSLLKKMLDVFKVLHDTIL